MRINVTLTEKCIERGNRATDEEKEPAGLEGGGGFSGAVKLAVNMYCTVAKSSPLGQTGHEELIETCRIGNVDH